MWMAFSLAHAGPTDEVATALARYPGRTTAVSCAPLADLAHLLGELPLDRLQGPERRLLEELADPLAARELGLDPQGALTLVARDGDAGTEVSLPFDGTDEQAGALVRRLDPRARGEDGRWQLHLRGEPHLVVHEPGGAWVLVQGTQRPPAPQPVEVPPALADLPEVAGCTLWVADLPAAAAQATEPIDGIGGFVPLHGGAPAVVRLVLRQPLPPVPEAPIPVGRATEPPDAVATVSVPLQDVLALALTAEGHADLLAPLRKHLSMPSGASLAAWTSPGAKGRFAGVVEVLDERGRPYRAHKLAKLARRALRDVAPVERMGRDGLVVGAGDRTLYVRIADDGRVAFGSERLLPSLALSAGGTPWLDAEALERARGTWVRVVAEGEIGMDLALRALDERTIELRVELELGARERASLRRAVEAAWERSGVAPAVR